MFENAKDLLTSRAVLLQVEPLIARYGKVQDLQINSRCKTVEMTCLLDGEPGPIVIRIENYLIETVQGRPYIRATTFGCTRRWLQTLLADFGPRQKIELPSWAAAAL